MEAICARFGSKWLPLGSHFGGHFQTTGNMLKQIGLAFVRRVSGIIFLMSPEGTKVAKVYQITVGSDADPSQKRSILRPILKSFFEPFYDHLA